MSLTTEQITEIKQFINSRGFTHIEVEMEILDHVASATEDKLKQNPNLSLQKAIQEIHASFGIFGFSTIEEEKQKHVSFLIRKQYWGDLKSFFTPERGAINIMVILGLLILTQLKNYISIEDMRHIPYIFATALALTIGIRNYRRFSIWKNKSLMISLSVFPLYLIQPQFGNIIGLVTEDIARSNPPLAGVFLISTVYLLILMALACYYTMNWGYRWTYERYLKYTI